MGRAVNADSMAAPGSESPLLAAGVLHETGWVFCWAARVVSEVIWVGCRLAWGSGLGCQLQPRYGMPELPADTRLCMEMVDICIYFGHCIAGSTLSPPTLRVLS